jgi:hypothetical protein
MVQGSHDALNEGGQREAARCNLAAEDEKEGAV